MAEPAPVRSDLRLNHVIRFYEILDRNTSSPSRPSLPTLHA